MPKHPSREESLLVAQICLHGDHSDPETLVAWVIAISGLCNILNYHASRIKEFTETGDAAWAAFADLLKDVDVEETVLAVSFAAAKLRDIEVTLKEALDNWEHT